VPVGFSTQRSFQAILELLCDWMTAISSRGRPVRSECALADVLKIQKKVAHAK
jgi:hypothetical protein